MILLKTYIYLVLESTIRLYTLVLFAYIIFGYFQPSRNAKWYIFLTELAEPPLIWARRITKGKMTIGILDLSPLLVFIGLEILSRILYYLFKVI